MTRKQATKTQLVAWSWSSRWFWAKLWQVAVAQRLFLVFTLALWQFLRSDPELESRNTKSRNESWVRNPIQPTPAQQNSTFIGFGWLRLFTPEMSCFMHPCRIWQVQLTLLVSLWQNAAGKVFGLGGISKKKEPLISLWASCIFIRSLFFCGWGIVLKNIKECDLGTLTILLTRPAWSSVLLWQTTSIGVPSTGWSVEFHRTTCSIGRPWTWREWEIME